MYKKENIETKKDLKSDLDNLLNKLSNLEPTKGFDREDILSTMQFLGDIKEDLIIQINK